MSAQAAKRYAKALFELADEKDIVEQIYTDLHDFSSILEQQERVHALFHSIDTQISAKQQIFDDLLKEKSSPYFLNFIKVIFQKRRENLFPQIIKEYDMLYDKMLNRVNAKIISAVALQESTTEKITTALSQTLNSTVILETAVDPHILGGFQLLVQDEILDASLKRKLEDMKALLHKGFLN